MLNLSFIISFFLLYQSSLLHPRSILSPNFVLDTTSTMIFRHKTLELQRRTARIRAQSARHRERREIRAAAALQRRADSTLRQHRIAMDPGSIDNAKRIQRATCDLSRLVNPGPILLKGPASHPFYINAEFSNGESGVKEEDHFDHRHPSAAWIWDNATCEYIPRHYWVIDLTEQVLMLFGSLWSNRKKEITNERFNIK